MILRISGIFSGIPCAPATSASFCSAVAESKNENTTTCLNRGSTDGFSRRDVLEGDLLLTRLGGLRGLDRRSSSGRFLAVGEDGAARLLMLKSCSGSKTLMKIF